MEEEGLECVGVQKVGGFDDLMKLILIGLILRPLRRKQAIGNAAKSTNNILR